MAQVRSYARRIVDCSHPITCIAVAEPLFRPACKTCGYVSLQEEASSLVACPCCQGQDLFKQRFVIPEGFAPDINVRREVDRGDASAPRGSFSPA